VVPGRLIHSRSDSCRFDVDIRARVDPVEHVHDSKYSDILTGTENGSNLVPFYELDP